MNKIITPLVIAAVTFLSGCASEGYRSVSLETARANIQIATAKAQASQKPLFVADIPMPDGQIAHFELAQPSVGGKNDYLRAPEDPMMRVLDRGMGILGTAAGIYLGGNAAKGLVEATSKGIAGSLSQMPDPVIVQPPAYNDPIIVRPPETVIVEQPPYNDPIVVPPSDPIFVDKPVIIEPTVITNSD